MIHPLQVFYTAENRSTPLNNIARFKIPGDGIVRSIIIWAIFAPVSNAIFQAKLNGVTLFASDQRPTITPGTYQVEKSNLNQAVLKGDTFSFDLSEIGSGGLSQPIFFQVMYDDGLHSQTVTNYTSVSIANNAAADVNNFTLGKTFVLTKVSADRACRMRLYSTDAARAADVSRAPGTEPMGEHGVIADLVFTSGNLTLDLAPIIFGSDQKATRDGQIPMRLDNLSGADHTIALTFTKILIEV